MAFLPGHRVASLALCVALLGVGSSAQADDNAEARAYFEQGNRLLTSGLRARGPARQRALEGAFDAYVESLRIVRSRNVVYNTSVVLEELGRFDESFTYLREYLSFPHLSEADREEATQRMKTLRPRVAVLAVRSQPPGAEVRVDRRDLAPVGTTPLEVAVQPGTHRVFLRRDGYEDYEGSAEATVGSEVELAATLTPRPAPTLPPAVPREGTLVVETGRPDATVYVDHARFGGGQRVQSRLSLGRHRIRVEAPGHLPATQEVEVSAGRSTTLIAELQPPTTDRKFGLLPEVAWVGAGTVGLAALILGGRALSLNSTFEDDSTRRNFEQVQDANRWADIAGFTALGIAAVAVVLTLLDEPLEHAPSKLRLSGSAAPHPREVL